MIFNDFVLLKFKDIDKTHCYFDLFIYLDVYQLETHELNLNPKKESHTLSFMELQDKLLYHKFVLHMNLQRIQTYVSMLCTTLNELLFQLSRDVSNWLI